MSFDNIKGELAEELAKFLQERLPKIGGGDWWEVCVCNHLSPAQQQSISAIQPGNLDRLDLAALLRICDSNWQEMRFDSNFPELPWEGYTYLKELRDVRNRWAHTPAGGFPDDDTLRDIDTALRFLVAIGAETQAIQTVQEEKQELVRRVAGVTGASAGSGNSRDGGSDPGEEDPEVIPEELPEQASGTIVQTGGNTSEREEERPPPSKLPIGNLRENPELFEQAANLLAKNTFVGIDFGTSTTVASLITLDSDTCSLIAEPIPVSQDDKMGVLTDYHLVPSCIAWFDDRLIVGRGAAKLRHDLTEGKNVWSSFKMELGIDLGPKYTRTILGRDGPGPVIEKPQDAAREFFIYLRESIEKAVRERELPADIRYVVSVPASFEANQRQDLTRVLSAANIEVEASCLIDEPNAGFLNYVHEGLSKGNEITKLFEEKARRILVFDFGAGTCDVSILEIASQDGQISSKNLSVSRFFALGGNNIDEEIATTILLPQLLESAGSDIEIPTHQKETAVIPRLMPEAESLKIQCCKMLETRGITTLEEALKLDDEITGNAIPTISVRETVLTLNKPILKMTSFSEIMAPFLDTSREVALDDYQVKSVFAPIQNALSKAKLNGEDLDALLFIGGSSLNPLVREAIKAHFGRFAEPIVPFDLRAHVSQGAAVHSYLFHALNFNMVHPITSETIYIVSAGGNLVPIIQAGT